MARTAFAVIVACLASAACQQQSPPPEAVTTEVAPPGLHDVTGPVLSLGTVPTVDGGQATLTAARNEAGGVCLYEDGDEGPGCLTPIPVRDAPVSAVVVSRGDRRCTYVFAPMDVTAVSFVGQETNAELGQAERVVGAEDLGFRLYVGCYTDPSSWGDPRLRYTLETGEEELR